MIMWTFWSGLDIHFLTAAALNTTGFLLPDFKSFEDWLSINSKPLHPIEELFLYLAS